MKRMTIAGAAYSIRYAEDSRCIPACEMSDRQIKDVLARLFEYENTGLTPEEIELLKKRYEDDKR